MFRTALAGMCLAALPVWAEPYPAPGTVLVYELRSTLDDQPTEVSTFETIVLSSNDQTVVVAECQDWGCDVSAYRDFARSLGHVAVDTLPEVGSTLSDIQGLPGFFKVPSFGGPGRSFFPLEDGKQMAWSEDWSATGFPITYEIDLNQICCTRTQSGLSAGQDLWTITYEFEDVTGPNETVGTGAYSFDPELGWYVGYTEVIRYKTGWGGETARLVQTMTLLDVKLP